jgi:hypothetical protein
VSDVRTYTEINEQVETPSPNGHQPVVPTRSRSLPGQINMVLLRPVQFYRALRAAHDTRQWVMIALITLILVGYSAVRQTDEANSGETASITPDMGMDGAVPGDPFAADDPGMAVVDPGAGAPDAGGTSEDSSASWQTGLIAASNYVAAWFLLAVLLCNVSLIRGTAPRLGQNLQIAIWATLPLALMAVLQVIYFWRGGKAGEPGISGLLPEWSGYHDLSNAERDLLQSLTMRLTVFGVWALALAYIGARQVLHGKRWSAALTVIAWATLIVVLPVVLGTVKAPEVETPAEEIMGPTNMEGMMPEEGLYPDEGMIPDGTEGRSPEGDEGESGSSSEGEAVPVPPKQKG